MHGLIFGMNSAVNQFIRMPQLIVTIARRYMGLMTSVQVHDEHLLSIFWAYNVSVCMARINFCT